MEFRFIWATAAQLKGNIPSGMHSSRRTFQQPHANGVRSLLAHLHRNPKNEGLEDLGMKK